ncbi:MAG: hypothetical protein LBH58_00440 [Tannerellaceae bacterium]|jgi:DNA-binding NarL/FixJ family response regulator|nr:hypothetical protein [Tannerellaceae bacterium]
MKKEAANEDKIRVYLADRHIMIADEVEKHIEDSRFAEVVGRSDSLKECRRKLASDLLKGYKLPDVLLLDISDTNGIEMDIIRKEKKEKFIPMPVEEVRRLYKIPEGNGIDFCKEMKGLYPDMKILVYSGYTHWYPIRLLAELGIGHVSKNSPIMEISRGIDIAMSDGIPHCGKSKVILQRDKPGFWFTCRENDVVKLLGEGYSNKEMSNILGIDVSAIESNRKIIIKKIKDTFDHRSYLREAKEMALIWADKVP